jgi:hypothetical protein
MGLESGLTAAAFDQHACAIPASGSKVTDLEVVLRDAWVGDGDHLTPD